MTPPEEDQTPVPAEAAPPVVDPPRVVAAPAVASPVPPKREPIRMEPVETGTRTLPAMHGVVLRAPAHLAKPATPPVTPLPIKSIQQLMVEADPMRALSQSGSVRLLKRSPADVEAAIAPAPPAESVSDPSSASSSQPPPIAQPAIPPGNPPIPSSPWPSYSKASAPEVKKSPTALMVKALSQSIPAKAPEGNGIPILLRSTPPAASAAKESSSSALPPEPAPLLPFGLVFRRKAKLTEVARIVLPRRREETQPLPPPPETAPTVIPAAFPVAGLAARPAKTEVENPEAEKISDALPAMTPSLDEAIMGDKRSESIPPGESATRDASSAMSAPVGKAEIAAAREIPEPVPVTQGLSEPEGTGAPPSSGIEEKTVTSLFGPPQIDTDAHQAETSAAPEPKVDPEAHKAEAQKPEASIAPEPKVDMGAPKAETSLAPEPKVEPEAPRKETSAAPELKIDPEAHKPEPTAATEPKIDSEAHKPQPQSLQPVPREPSNAPSGLPEKREFHLANGERVVGVVLSETPEAVYIDHGALGVLTIPRAQIAKRLVEIILINGDRIVGDIMAETADTLYVRHASLGMLTVPRAQRSTRVVEAILKDGDRILGEILTETEGFTVIRSATLGTITVPHDKVAMLNRKIEQIELKALSLPAPEGKDKP